ncbi:hypothetical protein [Jatrophihabitans sp.]|uniref:hypothetical protein n=1 Tax=Jatrophihabitans sp. TaxID=1932789 RepID=UPI002C068060|nr:hypothetical protein [Jatrophihabitans sp.]
MVVLLLVASLALLVSGLITGGTPLVVISIVASLLAGYLISRYRNRQPATGTPSRRPAAAPADPPVALVGRSGTPSAGSVGSFAVPAGRPAVPSAGVAGAPTRVAGSPADLAGAPPTGLAGAPSAGGGAVSAPAVPAPPAASDPAAGLDPAAQAGGEPVGRHSQEAHLAEQDEPEADDPPIAETDPPLRSRGDESVWVIDGRPRYHLADCDFLLDREPEPVPLRQAVEDGFTPCALCDPDSGLVAAANRG